MGSSKMRYKSGSNNCRSRLGHHHHRAEASAVTIVINRDIPSGIAQHLIRRWWIVSPVSHRRRMILVVLLELRVQMSLQARGRGLTCRYVSMVTA